MKKLFNAVFYVFLATLPAQFVAAAEPVAIHPKVEGRFVTPFEISLPNNFVFGYQQPQQRSGVVLIEFIPKGESVENWSEIITVMKLPTGWQGDPSQFIAGMKHFFDQSAGKDGSLQSEASLSRENGVVVAMYLFDGPYSSPMTNYKNSPTENQIVIVKSAQTADGSVWNIQYAIRYPRDLESIHKGHLFQKLQTFMDNCKIIKENCPKS